MAKKYVRDVRCGVPIRRVGAGSQTISAAGTRGVIHAAVFTGAAGNCVIETMAGGNAVLTDVAPGFNLLDMEFYDGARITVTTGGNCTVIWDDPAQA